MSMPLAIIFGAALVAGAVLFVFRWELAGAPPLLLDRWTGAVVACGFTSNQRPNKLTCEEAAK
jgi:uncharacterized membrane protein AbrB (regulator of aidB expression)